LLHALAIEHGTLTDETNEKQVEAEKNPVPAMGEQISRRDVVTTIGRAGHRRIHRCLLRGMVAE
jgi:hypothetical protein